MHEDDDETTPPYTFEPNYVIPPVSGRAKGITIKPVHPSGVVHLTVGQSGTIVDKDAFVACICAAFELEPQK